MFGKKISRRQFLGLSAVAAASMTIDWNKLEAIAGKIRDKRRFPALVIGAGLGGLCCGAFLARAGFPTVIVEQNTTPGGYATSFQRAGGKFDFEVSLHGTTVENNEAARILEKLGVLDKLRLAELPEIFRVKTPSWEYPVPQKDPEKLIEILSSRFPSETVGIAGYIHEMLAIEEEVDRYNRKKSQRRTTADLLVPLQFPRMWRIRNKTLEEHIAQFVADPECQAALGSLWAYYGLPPSKLSAFYYAIATGGYLKNGSCYIKDRSSALSDLLAGAFVQAGGTIRYGARVEKIGLRDGRVSGVTLGNGKPLAARAVAANCGAPAIFDKMLPAEAVPEKFRRKLAKCHPSISTFIVWLGLNEELRGKIDGCSYHMQRADSHERDYQDCIDGRVDRGYYSVTIYDNAYEGYSGPGLSTVMVLFACGYGPWKKFEQDYWRGEKTAYYEQKKRWTDILIRRAEKDVIPGLSGMIEVVEAATPLTNWRYTGNADGAIYGFEQSMENSFVRRISEDPPVKGLFLASAWANPGGGFTGVLQGGAWAFLSMLQYYERYQI